MKSIENGFKGLAGEFNGKNHEKRRKAREAERLLRDAEDTFKQVDDLNTAIGSEMDSINKYGTGLGLAGKELESVASDAAMQGIASRYNAKKDGILSQIPDFDETKNPSTANNGQGIYDEN
jgi:hypothetical protein